MEKTIHRMNNQFDFSKITISQPSAIQGGAYFTKIKYSLKETKKIISSLDCMMTTESFYS